jgi:hypothetical protein
MGVAEHMVFCELSNPDFVVIVDEVLEVIMYFLYCVVQVYEPVRRLGSVGA